MRKQYHFRPTNDGVLIWDVDRLVELSGKLPILDVPINEIRELDDTFWFEDRDALPTCRRIAQHAKLINAADLSHPIILSQTGQVMDGMHRVCKALILGLESLPAVQFPADPKPDFVDRSPNDLPY